MGPTPSRRAFATPAQILRLLLVAVLPALLVYVLLVRLSIAAGLEPIHVIRDLAQPCDTPIGVGLMPNLGVLLWMAAAAIALFTAFSGLVEHPRWRGLLILGGSLSLLLTLDDFLLLHDRHIGPTFLYGLYAVLALAILLRQHDLLRQCGGAASFLAAAVLLGSSVLIDATQESWPFRYQHLQLVEEGAKFVGIACWLLFWWQASSFAAKLRSSH